jgi:hypothetical protein
MNWRRGLLLAGINVAVALPMIGILASREAQFRREWKEAAPTGQTSRLSRPAVAALVRVQEEQTVSFNPCLLWGHPPVQVSVVQMGNLPAFAITQWRVDCPAKWSIAGLLGVDDSGFLSDHNFRAMRRVDVALCILIAIQWFLIGAFPTINAHRWWSEPDVFITLCTAMGSGIALITAIEFFGRLPAVIAFFAWLWYFLLLLWKPVHLAWQSTLHGFRRLS